MKTMHYLQQQMIITLKNFLVQYVSFVKLLQLVKFVLEMNFKPFVMNVDHGVFANKKIHLAVSKKI